MSALKSMLESYDRMLMKQGKHDQDHVYQAYFIGKGWGSLGMIKEVKDLVNLSPHHGIFYKSFLQQNSSQSQNQGNNNYKKNSAGY